VWYKFFRKTGPGIDGGPSRGVTLTASLKDFQAHKEGTSVLAVIALADGKSMISSGLDGSLHLWREPFDKPVNSVSTGAFQIRLLAPDPNGGSNCAAVTSDNRVLLVDVEKLTTSELFKAPNLTTLHWPRGGVVAGDTQGKLWRSTVQGKPISKKNARITAIASRGEELFVATAANELFVLDVNSLEPSRSYELSDGSADAIATTEHGAFVIVGNALRPLMPNGLGAERMPVDGMWLAAAHGSRFLVVVAGGALVYVDPAGLKPVASAPLSQATSVICLAAGVGSQGAAAGTSRGRLLYLTAQ
jgi:hypothetical protein